MNQLDITIGSQDGITYVSGLLTTMDGEQYHICETCQTDDTEVGSLGGWLKGAVKTVTKPFKPVTKPLYKAVKKVAHTAEGVVKNKYFAAATISLATATGFGAPAAAAYGAALAVIKTKDEVRGVIRDGKKVAKAVRGLSAKGKVSVKVKAQATTKSKGRVTGPGYQLALVQAMAANNPKLRPLLAKLKARAAAAKPKKAKLDKLSTNLTGMLKYGSPEQKRKAARNLKVLQVVAKGEAAKKKLAAVKAEQAARALLITVNGRIVKGLVGKGATRTGTLIQDGSFQTGTFKIG